MHGNDATKMFQSGIFRMSWVFQPQCTIFGKFSEHFRKTAGKCQENCRLMPGKLENWEHSKCSWHFPEVFPNFSKNSTLWSEHSGHSEYTTLEHFGCIVPMCFEFYWLGKLGLLRWGHHKEHFEWATQEHCGNILWVHFEFSHIFHNQEITWVHCECPKYFLSWGNSS